MLNKRYMTMNENNIQWRLGSVISLMTAQPIMFASTLIIGLLCLALGGLFIFKWHKEHKDEQKDFNWDSLVNKSTESKSGT